MNSSLSHRSRSDLTIDSFTESQIGSVTGSESGLLGSVSSLNDTTHDANDDTETEQRDDYTPVPGKIVILCPPVISSNFILYLMIYKRVNYARNRFWSRTVFIISRMATSGWKSPGFPTPKTTRKSCRPR